MYYVILSIENHDVIAHTGSDLKKIKAANPRFKQTWEIQLNSDGRLIEFLEADNRSMQDDRYHPTGSSLKLALEEAFKAGFRACQEHEEPEPTETRLKVLIYNSVPVDVEGAELFRDGPEMFDLLVLMRQAWTFGHLAVQQEGIVLE